MWPAPAAAGTVLVGGMTAREFGGARRARFLAAIATATMPVLPGGAHIANTTSCEVLAWAAITLVVVRIGRPATHGGGSRPVPWSGPNRAPTRENGRSRRRAEGRRHSARPALDGDPPPDGPPLSSVWRKLDRIRAQLLPTRVNRCYVPLESPTDWPDWRGRDA